jgi:hypothetical protein
MPLDFDYIEVNYRGMSGSPESAVSANVTRKIPKGIMDLVLDAMNISGREAINYRDGFDGLLRQAVQKAKVQKVKELRASDETEIDQIQSDYDSENP